LPTGTPSHGSFDSALRASLRMTMRGEGSRASLRMTRGAAPFGPLSAGRARDGTATIAPGGAAAGRRRSASGPAHLPPTLALTLSSGGGAGEGTVTGTATATEMGTGEKEVRGKGSKARKACLGWNSRQDGGRLVERSGSPSPGFLLKDPVSAPKKRTVMPVRASPRGSRKLVHLAE